MNKPNKQAFGPTINRIADLMAHTDRYAFKGVSRLAQDARVNASALSRVVNGRFNPSFRMMARITDALERELGLSLDPRDLIAENGEFRTTFACTLAGCKGCLPVNALDEFGDLKPAFAAVCPGTWVTSRYPRGYRSEKGGK